ncbi:MULTISPECIES: urease accessory protein UreE [Paracoccus]|uniref:urease accessory protein UreE n=1 Tax=Paracoccus TaxID=265 RepID=UPI001FB7B718|nr:MULTISPECIES: urease accessory protein UreE [Paracoccus]MCJ1900553.1 urease accessory protein UreE [Paracoccus versutus]MDF3905562.1 urease accessory protein UreE [Paracoccus sp. AS002]
MKATAVLHPPLAARPIDRVELDYDARFLRRKLLRTRSGADLLVDLPKVTALAHGDALLSDAGPVEIIAAEEPVLIVTGDLPRLAWHIGNRHTPCQIEPFHLVIRADHVLRAMLQGLGATVTEALRPFTPEGGAYGPAQVMGHSHGHGHGDGHGHQHAHGHPHPHG